MITPNPELQHSLCDGNLYIFLKIKAMFLLVIHDKLIIVILNNKKWLL